jgi:Zn finger protein HypA/HybF involved in hydrogenase expression
MSTKQQTTLKKNFFKMVGETIAVAIAPTSYLAAPAHCPECDTKWVSVVSIDKRGIKCPNCGYGEKNYRWYNGLPDTEQVIEFTCDDCKHGWVEAELRGTKRRIICPNCFSKTRPILFDLPKSKRS